MPDFLSRDATITAHDVDTRTLTVQLLAWDDPRPVSDGGRPYRERWARDSLIPLDRLFVWDAHGGQVIGRMDPPTDAGPGPTSELHIAHTRAGDDLLALVDAEVIRDVSVEFRPEPGGEIWAKDRSEVTRTRALIRGVAFTPTPAHDAPVLAREENPAMSEDTPTPEPAPVAERSAPLYGYAELQAEMVAVREQLATVGRTPAVPGFRYRSIGEAVQAAASTKNPGDDPDYDPRGGGIFLNRALVDVVTGDVPGLIPRPSLTQFFQAVTAAQPLVEAAGSAPLPDSGMDISYPSITTRPTVAIQATQKTAIASAKTTIARNTVPVVTFAGGEDDSIQVLQRSSPSYLEVVTRLYAEAMATASDAYAVSIFAGTVVPAGHHASIGTAATGWTAAIAGLQALLLKDAHVLGNRMVLSPDLWQKFVGAADADGRPLFPNVAASNPVGASSLDSTDGNLRGLTWTVDPNLPADRGLLFDSNSFITMMGGVQTMTQDVPAVLGRDFAVFRFGAVAAVNPAGMVVFATGTAPVVQSAKAKKDD